jgi:Zn-dependent peptidase ImmA (M78 family)
VRQRAELAPLEPLGSVEDAAYTVTKVPFRVQEQNHVPGSGVRAAVGWNADREIVLAGPRSQRLDSQRFLDARCLYHALFACGRSERLVTDAYTWDQQASRAFAAEFLAPQAALTARTGVRTDRLEVEELARDFGVSAMLIEKQLENAGVAITDE